jgi:hypothetical protein
MRSKYSTGGLLILRVDDDLPRPRRRKTLCHADREVGGPMHASDPGFAEHAGDQTCFELGRDDFDDYEIAQVSPA